MKRLLAIGSGKGGVGKTWLAISLSQAFAHLGFRTLLVDGDVGLANVDVQLGLPRGSDLGTELSNGRPFNSSIRSLPTIGIDVLLGQSGGAAVGCLDSGLATRIVSELSSLRERYDLIVLDLPSGNGHGMRRLMMAADDAIVLTTEEPTALTDAYALIKTIWQHRPELRPQTIVNLAGTHQSGRRISDGLSRVCNRFLNSDVACPGVIRRDRRVVEAIGRQTPLFQCYPNSDAARDIMAVAKTLTSESE